MKPALFLRIAAVLTFVHAVLHTIGGVLAEPDPGPCVWQLYSAHFGSLFWPTSKSLILR